MKKISFIFGLCLLVNFAAFSQDNNSDNSSSDDVYYQGDDQGAPPADQAPQDQAPDNDNGPVTYQTFYDQLSPYGQWVNTPEYGNVWVPNNQNGFTPYLTNGYWVYTEYGWTWVSNDPWGWGPFHYGRWYDDPVLGWAWVPGYDWAPAWVTWGNYDGYYCWAPIWPGAVVGPQYRPDARYWNFIPHDHIGYRNPGSFVVRPEVAYHGNVADFNAHVNVISHANTYHQSVFFAGPKVGEVEHYTGTKIAPVKIASSDKPMPTKMNGSQVTMYRPAVARTNNQPAPKNVRPASSVQPTQRGSTSEGQQQHANHTEQRSAPIQQRSTPSEQQRSTPTETRSSWTPPRQPSRQSAPTSNFIPSPRSAPAPAPSRSFGGGGGGGGGSRGGGGGGRR